jgi:DNA ligase (NAD+)
VAKKIVLHCKNIETLMSMSFDELCQIEEVGEKIAKSIIEFFDDDYNIQIINLLRQVGLQFESDGDILIQSNILEGKQIVVSGDFSRDRDEMKKLIEIHGGKVVSSISKNTSFVLSGENMGPAKLQKAKELGIEIVSELEFDELIAK